MHHSRLCAIGIDAPADVADATASFWSGALTPSPTPHEGFAASDPYMEAGAIGDREVFVQRIGEGPARVHLDIETDDVDAEVARLEALGATKVEQIKTWWVMRDPAGQLFCVVRPQTPDFPGDAVSWP